MDKGTSNARRRPLPSIQFRVLIVGRANAGKTTILQRVCDTTDDPEIQPTSERGEHDISDELVFTNNRGYVFHDSRGFENGDEEQLKIVQNFVRDRSKRNNLKERLHAIWFCISADTRRPGLDIAPFNKICPDENVPMIAVFTKYEALRHTIRCGLEDDDEDDGGEDLLIRTSRETERIFEKEFLGKFDEKPRFVRLESMDQPGKRCDNLIETTMVALNDEIVTLMLLAVQRQNLQFSVRTGVRWAFDMHNLGDSGWPVKECLRAFPSLWFFDIAFLDDLGDDLDFLTDRKLLDLDKEAKEDLKDRAHTIYTAIAPLHHVFPTNSPKFLIIAATIILHHATLLVANRRITSPEAIQQALIQYSKSSIGGQVQTWLTEFPSAEQDEIVQFIMEQLPMI